MALKPRAFSSGELSHRLTLYAPEGTTPAAVATGVPAKVIAVPLQFQQREQFGAGGLNGQTAYTVMVRYREDVRREYQWREECCTQRTFHIVAVQPTERGDGLECTCIVGER